MLRAPVALFTVTLLAGAVGCTGAGRSASPARTSVEDDPARAEVVAPDGPGAAAARWLFTTPQVLPPGLEAPEVVDVAVTLDPAGAATKTIDAEAGGRLQATDGEGNRYVLTVPDDVLVFDTEITMTPITAASGFDAPDTRLAGVALEPHGLRFYDWVTLEVFPAGAGARQPALAYATHGDGLELHGRTLDPDPDRLLVPLLHFSDTLLYLGDGIWVSEHAPAYTRLGQPVDWESQIQQAAQQLLARDRQDALRGEEGDPEVSRQLEELVDLYYDKVVAPIVERMGTDCAFAEANMHTALSWSRQEQMVGSDEDDPRQQRVTDATIQALDSCWEEATRRCLDLRDEAAVTRLIGLSRQMALIGADEAEYDVDFILDPESHPERFCGDVHGTVAWELRTSEELDLAGASEVRELVEVIVLDINMDRVDGRYVDRGSTYRWSGREEESGAFPGCATRGERTWSGNGAFEPGVRELYIDEVGDGRVTLAASVDGTSRGRRVDCDGSVSENSHGPEAIQRVVYCPDPSQQIVEGTIVESGATIEVSCDVTNTSANSMGRSEKKVAATGTLTVGEPSGS